MTTYRERQRQKAQAQAAQERDLLRATHEANAKHNARLKAQGVGGRFECPPACYLCHPDAAQDGGRTPGLGAQDLRGKVMPIVLRGKRGRCQACRTKLTNRRGWFCPDCLVRRARDKRYGR